MRNHSWYTVYAVGHITNYKVWKANTKKLMAGKAGAVMLQHGNTAKTGVWMPSDSDAKKNSWNHYITVTSGTRNLTQKQQLGNATATLGNIIGASSYANPIHGDEGLTDDITPLDIFYNFKVTQSDLDHVDWIYAHPWSGSNVFWDNATVLG